MCARPLRTARPQHVRRAAGPAEDAPAASARSPPPRARCPHGPSPGRGGARAQRARGRTGGRVASWSSARPPCTRLTRGFQNRDDMRTSETSHVWTSVPRPPKKNPNVRRLYDVPTRDAACRTRDGFIADSMDIRYRALWISRVDGASSMPDGAHWLAQSRSPQTPSRRAGCGSLMWAALSMSICVIIRGGVLRLAEAAAAAVA